MGACCLSTSRADHDDSYINDIWAILSSSGVSWCRFPLLGKRLEGVLLSGTTALEKLFLAVGLALVPQLCRGRCAGICNDDSTSQTSLWWPGEVSYMQCVAKHPLFTMQGVVPSLSCSGAFWLFRFPPPTPFTSPHQKALCLLQSL